MERLPIKHNQTRLETFNTPELRSQVLSAYLATARYLETADICVTQMDGKEKVLSRGSFSIPESCYIQSTGHFNSVEFNICYNQIMYDAVAHVSKYKLASYFSEWSIEDFFAHQLPDILITRFHSRFNSTINPTRFWGEFVIHSARLTCTGQKFLFLKTGCRFFDDAQGEAIGEIDLAILNP